MKTTRVMLGSFFAVAALSAGLPLGAQTVVQFVVISKEQVFTETPTGAVPTVYDAVNHNYPWRVATEINGSGFTSGSFTGNLVTTPGGTTTSYTIPYGNFDPNSWKARLGFANQGSMDTAVTNGVFTVNLGGTTTPFSVSLGTSSLYPNMPEGLPTLSGGTWSNGVYLYNPASGPLTIGTGTYSANFSPTNSRISVNIDGPGTNYQKDIGVGSHTAFGPSDTSGSVTVTSADLAAASATFIVGNTYNVDLEFNNVVDFHDISMALGQGANTASAAGIFASRTSFSIMAVPEPSTYAAIFGVVALVGVMIHRRRRAAV